MEKTTRIDNCPLCNLERRAIQHYEDKEIVIVDCMVCGKPVLIFKQHEVFAPVGASSIWGCIVWELFGPSKWDQETNHFQGHLHWHIEILEDERSSME